MDRLDAREDILEKQDDSVQEGDLSGRTNACATINDGDCSSANSSIRRARSVLYSSCRRLESIWDQHLRDRLVELPALKSGSISRPMRMGVYSAGRIVATFLRLRNPRSEVRPRRVRVHGNAAQKDGYSSGAT